MERPGIVQALPEALRVTMEPGRRALVRSAEKVILITFATSQYAYMQKEFSSSCMRLITLVRSARGLGRNEQSVGGNDTRGVIHGCIAEMVNDRKIANE